MSSNPVAMEVAPETDLYRLIAARNKESEYTKAFLISFSLHNQSLKSKVGPFIPTELQRELLCD